MNVFDEEMAGRALLVLLAIISKRLIADLEPCLHSNTFVMVGHLHVMDPNIRSPDINAI